MKIKFLIKVTLASLAVLGTGLTAGAVPAKPGVLRLAQPDGSVIELQRAGDEHCHALVDGQGQPVAKGADGFYRAIAAEKFSTIAARRMQEMRKSLDNKKFRAPGVQESQVPNIGSPRIPVLLVAYNDLGFRDGDNALQTFKNFFDEGESSARQYFVDQSNGLYTPEFDVYGPVTLSNNRAVYGANDEMGNDVGVGQMVAEACQWLQQDIDFSVYDNNGDGECDVVIVLYAGDGEASSNLPDAANSVWPMQNQLDTSDYGTSLNFNGIKVNKFAVFNELSGENPEKIDGIGTFCHEFSHCLGLPDFYDTNYGGHFGMGDWSLMDNGCYNNDGYTPIGYSAYEKAFMGWIEIKEAERNTSYTLTPMNGGSIETDMAVRLTNDSDPDEYYIIENRARRGWDSFIEAEGLMISHVTYSAYAWAANCVNDFDLQRMTIIPADNELKLTGINADKINLRGDLWPYAGNDALTDTSVPAATVNTGNFMGKPITDMVRNHDGTVSFNVMKGVLPQLETPQLADAGDVAPDAFTASWQHDALTGLTYTLEVTDHNDVASRTLLAEDFTQGKTAWTTEGYTSQSAPGLRMGSGSSNGKATTPEIEAPGERFVTVAFNARTYSPAESSAAKISVLDKYGNVYATETIELTTEAADYAARLDIRPGKPFLVRFETIGLKKRLYLAKAAILAGDMTDVALDENGTGAAPAAPLIFTGLTETRQRVSGLKAGTYDFRVKAVPADTAAWAESAWTDRRKVTVAGSGIIAIEADGGQARYYNLQGCQVDRDKLVPGIYIKHTDAGAEKVIVR